MGILTIGLIGAMRVFPVGLRASERAEKTSRANILAQRTIESLKLAPWDEVTGQTLQEDEFTVTTAVAQPAGPGLVDPSRLKAIQVTVQWTQNSRPRSLTVGTYLRREDS